MKKTTIHLLWTLIVLVVLNMSQAAAQRQVSGMEPEEVMKVIGVKEGLVIGEIGAGRGYLTLSMAKTVGSRGCIYANDVDRFDLQYLEEECRKKGITNVKTILGKTDDPMFPKNSLDLAFMSFVFHMLEKPVGLLTNLKPSLKTGAKLAILDFDPEKRRGPYPENAKIVELAAKAGYALDRIEKFSDRDNIWIFNQAN